MRADLHVSGYLTFFGKGRLLACKRSNAGTGPECCHARYPYFDHQGASVRRCAATASMYAVSKGLSGLRSTITGGILTSASLVAGSSTHACRIAPPATLRISWMSVAYVVPTVSDSSFTQA